MNGKEAVKLIGKLIEPLGCRVSKQTRWVNSSVLSVRVERDHDGLLQQTRVVLGQEGKPFNVTQAEVRQSLIGPVFALITNFVLPRQSEGDPIQVLKFRDWERQVLGLDPDGCVYCGCSQTWCPHRDSE